MNYTKKSFTVNAPGTKTYADNWEKTFRTAVPESYEDATGERRYWEDETPKCSCTAFRDFTAETRYYGIDAQCQVHGEVLAPGKSAT